MNESRSSFDSESNFSLVEHGSSRVGRASPLGPGHGAGSNGRVNSYSISTIMNAASSGPNLATTLNNLNPLRPTGPKTGATRGKPATPIVLSDLPKVSRNDFVQYIDSIKGEYATWSRLQNALVDTPMLEDLHAEDTAELDEEQLNRRQAVKEALDSSNLDHSIRANRELPSLEAIPQIFFQESFSLANPQTFDEVTIGSTVNAKPEGRPSSDTIRSDASGEMDRLLQEKLTHYLDIVEVHLSVEIRLRSASFFSALTNLQALDTQSAEALKQIALLKNMLQEVDDSVAKKGLNKLRQCKRRQRLNDLDYAIERVKEVLRALEQAEDLGEAGETQAALDLADELETEWHSSELRDAAPAASNASELQALPSGRLAIIGEDEEDEAAPASAASQKSVKLSRRTRHHPPVRISKIAALSLVPKRLANLRQYIAHTLETEFIAVITHDARENLEAHVSAKSSRSQEASLEVLAPAALGDRVNSLINGLTRCGDTAIDGTISAWRNAMLSEVRRVLREVDTSAVSRAQADPEMQQMPHATRLLAEEDDTTGDHSPSSRSSMDGERPALDGSSSALAGIRLMSHQAFMESIQQLHILMLGCISIADQQAQSVLGLVIEAYTARQVDKASAGDSSASDTRRVTVQSELQDGIQAVADLANIRLARIVTSRAEIHAGLPLADFVAVFNASWQFVLSCEVMCKKMIVGLRGVIVAQAKAFLQTFHQKHVSEAAELVEKEQWSPVDTPASVQQIVERFIESAISNPKEWDLSAGQSSTPDQNTNGGKPSKHLSIEDKTYFAVGAGLKIIEFLEEYLQVVVNLPLLTTDTMARIIELLKQFNSRVCQVVLGAGAMRSAGLKNITAKHLALASQSLSIMISLIPYIRECLRRHLRAKQAVILIDFDKLKRDYQEHQYEIHAKLVAIMGDRLAVHCSALQEIDWEVERAGEGGPNAYMQTLVKETATLHKVLYKYLPGSALETVMLQVLSAINSRLAEEYGKIVIKSDEARERILDDAKFMKAKFSELKGLEREIPGAGLEDLIRTKKVEKPTPAVLPKQFTTPSLTRSRGSISHKRTASSSSLLKAEAPSTLSSEATTPDIASATSKMEPLDIKTDLNPEKPPSALVEAAIAVSTAIEEEAEEVVPEMIPLPPSPTIEAVDVQQEQPVAEPTPDIPKPMEQITVLQKEEAPATPTKDIDIRKPPVPEKTVSPPPTTSRSPPPASNVKNRLAGLFSKRPTPSLPKVELPKVSIPQLSNIGIPSLRADRMFSPDRQQGSPAQARSSLDLPRAKALMEKQGIAAPAEEAIPEYEDVPLTAADAMEAAASAREQATAPGENAVATAVELEQAPAQLPEKPAEAETAPDPEHPEFQLPLRGHDEPAADASEARSENAAKPHEMPASIEDGVAEGVIVEEPVSHPESESQEQEGEEKAESSAAAIPVQDLPTAERGELTEQADQTKLLEESTGFSAPSQAIADAPGEGSSANGEAEEDELAEAQESLPVATSGADAAASVSDGVIASPVRQPTEEAADSKQPHDDLDDID